MFTGIITHTGKILTKSETKLAVESTKDFISMLNKGLSVAINGICLTIASFNKKSFQVDFMPETKARTNIGHLKSGDLVNLELPVTIETLFAGHIVQGHIDGVAKLEGVTKKGNSRILKLSIPNTLSRYIASKGSIAVSGISLTVIEAKKDYFTVGIVPYTWEHTALHTIKIGDFVNIEVDILAKYLESLLKK